MHAYLACLGVAGSLATACAPTERNPRFDAAVDAHLPADGGFDDDELDGGGTRRDACTGSACGDAAEAPLPSCDPACSEDAPVCDEGECGACADDDGCAAFPGAQRCIDGACFACASDDDCNDPLASYCDPATHACTACRLAPNYEAGDASCAHVTGQNVCSEAGCVQCTAESRTACGDNVCNALTHACATDRAPASADVCASCVSDAECKGGQLCVELTVPGVEPPVSQGWFCQAMQTASALCRENQPYARQFATKSIDRPDVEQTVCTLRVATCEATTRYSASCGRYGAAADAPVVTSINRYVDPATGNPGATITPAAAAGDIRPDDGLCGQGGECVAVVPEAGVYSCTVPCQTGSNLDCQIGSQCLGTERVCSVD